MSDLPALALPVARQLSAEVFRSGEAIAQQLNCSRATVHNAIRAVRQAGLDVHAIHGRGYRLAAAINWLDMARLEIEFAQRGITLDWHDQLASTNARMLHWAAHDAPQRALVCAEWQTHGRGRRGRNWQSGLGAGLTFSYLWRSMRPAAQLSGLSLAVGVALVEGLRDFGLTTAQVKWPNDIQIGGAKLAGVLIELASNKHSNDVLAPCSAVIGIGINLRGGAELSKSVGQPVTDLEAHLGAVDRNALLLTLVDGLDAALNRFEQSGFAAFHADWHACHAHQSLPVSLQPGQGEAIRGVMLGVDAQGALLLQTGSGIQMFHSGEVSLRVLPS